MSDMNDIVNELTSSQLQEIHGGGGKLDPGGYAIGVPIPPYDDKVAPNGGLTGGVVGS